MNKYAIENSGLITASKIKCFLNNPEEYFLKYVKMIDYDDESTKAEIIWTAFDDLICYGIDYFNKKYFIDDGFTVDQLKNLLDAQKKVYLKTDKKENLMFLYYWDVNDKIKLTQADWKTIFNMYEEAKRQPLFDFFWNYEFQKEIKVNYKNLTLKTKIDKYWKNCIRDFKTCANLDKFIFQATNEFNYTLSMAFYYMIVSIYDPDTIRDVILDVFQKSNWAYCAYKYQIEELNNCITWTIVPTLDKMNEMHEEFIKNWDEKIWNINLPHENVWNSDIFDKLNSAIQKNYLII